MCDSSMCPSVSSIYTSIQLPIISVSYYCSCSYLKFSASAVAIILIAVAYLPASTVQPASCNNYYVAPVASIATSLQFYKATKLVSYVWLYV